jgi:hypothetical protein
MTALVPFSLAEICLAGVGLSVLVPSPAPSSSPASARSSATSSRLVRCGS